MDLNKSKSEDYDGILVKRTIFYKKKVAKPGHAFFIISHEGKNGIGTQVKEFCSTGLTEEEEEKLKLKFVNEYREYFKDDMKDKNKKNQGQPKPTIGKLFKTMMPNMFIRLPEWKGYWIKTPSEVLVFTKEGRLLNTPDYEKFGDRADWNIVDMGSEQDLPNTIFFLKSMRKRIDQIRDKIDRLLGTSRAKSSAITNLEIAFMWLGLELKAVGDVNPYPASMDKNSPVIESPTDKSIDIDDVLIEPLAPLDDTGIVKVLRLEIERTIDVLRIYFTNQNSTKQVTPGSYPINMSVDHALANAKLWLGQQLAHIKTQQEKENKPSE